MIFIVFISALWLIPFHADAKPLDSANIYYLSVGSSHFVQSQYNKWNLSTIEAASRGARRVASLLDGHGAKHGTFLTSAEKKVDKGNRKRHATSLSLLMVSKQDVLYQLSKVVSVAKDDQTGRALIVVYLSSHGFAKGSAKAHYTVPSNIVFTRDPLKLPRRMTWNKLIYVGEIVRVLESSGSPYILILDTCYENSEEWHKKVYSMERDRFQQGPKAWDELIKTESTREKYKESYPVVFAVEAGGFVFTVPDPRDPSLTETLAPLARRMTLIFDKAKAEGITLSASDLVEGLFDENLDNLTTPGVSYSHRIAELQKYLLIKKPPGGKKIHLHGSAEEPVFCCSMKDFR